jgi:hypothetical protein
MLEERLLLDCESLHVNEVYANVFVFNEYFTRLELRYGKVSFVFENFGSSCFVDYDCTDCRGDGWRRHCSKISRT